MAGTTRRTLLLSSGGLLVAAVLGPSARAAATPFPVVASFSILADLVGQIGTGATRDDAIFHIVLHHSHTGLPRIGGTGHRTDIAFHGNGIAHA